MTDHRKIAHTRTFQGFHLAKAGDRRGAISYYREAWNAYLALGDDENAADIARRVADLLEEEDS